MALKRFFCSFGIILILTMSFITGYTKSVSFVYADSTTDQWTQVTTNAQLVEAFRYYCKSRDLTIEGSVADGVTTFTTKTFNGICKTLGIDVTALQAQIKYQTDGNLGNRFLFSALGIDAYNRIFAQFLQDNNLSVGDTVNDKTLYSGKLFYDYYGNYQLCTVTTSFNTRAYSISPNNIQIGNAVINPDYASLASQALSNAATIQYTCYRNAENTAQQTFNNRVYSNGADCWNVLYFYTANGSKNGFVSIIYNPSNGLYYIGVVSYDKTTNKWGTAPYDTNEIIYPKNRNSQNCNVYITTNNTTINNNTYEGDTIINNDGTPTDPNAPDPDDPNYNPYPDGGGTTTDPDNTGGGSGDDDSTITFPDFDFHFPEINWSLGDLSNKFPFSIPFDLIAFFTVLNAEPQAPAIDADIPLGSWYTWHFEADFAQFDNYAVIIRNVEFIGFCVGLIYLTIKLVKG